MQLPDIPGPTWFICAVFLFAGMLAILASVLNWNWFFNSSNARLITGRFSRRTARIFYFVIGGLILYMDYVILTDALART